MCKFYAVTVNNTHSCKCNFKSEITGTVPNSMCKCQLIDSLVKCVRPDTVCMFY